MSRIVDPADERTLKAVLATWYGPRYQRWSIDMVAMSV